MRTTVKLLALVGMGLCVATAARADWLAPVRIGDDAYWVTGGVLFPDASSGGVISLVGSHHTSYGMRRMNRATADGGLVTGWVPTGVDVAMDDSWPVTRFAPDGTGGLWRTWTDIGTLYLAQSIASGGSSVPFPVTATGSPMSPALADDGAGGAFVVWNAGLNLKLSRVQAGGSLAAGWPTGGATLSTMAGGALLAPDGAGGVLALASASNGSTFGMLLLRRTAAAGYPAGWTSAGLVLDSGDTPIALMPSGASHVLACWAKSGTTYLQRVALTGAIDPAWPATGLVIPTGARMVPDGADGLWLLSQSGTSVLLRHVLANGTWDPVFGAGGTNPLDAGATLDTSRLGVTCAAGANGGAILAWRDVRTGTPQVRVRWLLADGTSDLGEPAEPRVAVDQPAPGLTPILLDARTDEAGGAYLLWSADTTGYDPQFVNYWYDSYVTRVSPGSVTGVGPQLPAGSLALAAGPNPVRGALTVRFSLPDASPARLELLDLAGRRVRAMDVEGTGEHATRFVEPGALPPGLYLVKLSRGGDVKTVRIAVVR